MKKSIESGACAIADGTLPCQAPMTFGEMARVVATWPVGVINNIQLWLERGRQRRHLYGLSHHMLKDIGLSRADVDFEFRKLPWHE